MDSAGNPMGQFRLTTGEAIILTAMQAYMLDQDRLASGRHAAEKEKFWRRWCDDAVWEITKEATGDADSWNPTSFTGTGWETRFIDQLASSSDDRQQRRRLADAGRILARNVGDKSRVFLLLIELYAFYPWPPEEKAKWGKRARQESLVTLVRKMPAGTDQAYKEVDKKFKEVMRHLKLHTTNWWKVGGLAVAGGALGALTLGLAAPVIGGIVGGIMGYSGAVAVNAGLALLGGGSLAAGGAGMAGGTILLVGMGTATGLVLFTTTGSATGWTAGRVVSETVKLQVLTDLIILQRGDDVTARLVVEGFSERLEEVQRKIREMVEKLTELKASNAKLSEENRRLRSQLGDEREQWEFAASALSLAIKDVDSQLA